MSFLEQLDSVFEQLIEFLQSQTPETAHWILRITAEQSQFVRFNRAKVRQTGLVTDGSLTLTWMEHERSSYRQIPLTGEFEGDRDALKTALDELRVEVPQLPIDPYLVIPGGNQASHEIHTGQLLTPAAVVPTLLSPVEELDFAGLYAGGLSVRAYADSSGQHHWFATDTYTLDYSLFLASGQAVKGTFAGTEWDEAAYLSKIEESKAQLDLLSRPAKPIPRGQYRTYLAPDAVADLLGMLSWGAISEASLQQGGSALRALRQGEKQLSPLFHLSEDFQLGQVPRFNDWGELAPESLALIEGGQLVNTLVNQRTAKEYHQTANGANGSETLRSPVIQSGTLAHEQILSALETGLYLSNLHYLNWSDRPSGRITGMTRYACFWVENGEIIAPIENLRFDESLYRFWGENLMALTDFQELIPSTGTYGYRQLGGTLVPGMLVENFTYTL